MVYEYLNQYGRIIYIFLTLNCRASRIYFQVITNKKQRFFIYLFLQTLYMFQAVPPPIIRSTKLSIQLQVLSTNIAACCYRG